MDSRAERNATKQAKRPVTIIAIAARPTMYQKKDAPSPKIAPPRVAAVPKTADINPIKGHA